MNVINGVIGGVIGGLIGAALWAGISYGTGYEIGWIAWGVGGLVGLGSMWGAKGGGALMGCIAVAITVFALALGKYAAIQLAITAEIGSKSETIESALTSLQNDDFVVSYLADEIIADRRARGEDVEWPAGVDPDQASSQANFPPDVWTQATSRWKQTSDADRQAYRHNLGAQMRQNIEAFYDEVSWEGFLGSFAGMDLLFFGLAMVTAYKFGATGQENAMLPDDGEEATEGEEMIS